MKKILISIFLLIIIQPFCLAELVTDPNTMYLIRQRADERARMHQLDIKRAQMRSMHMRDDNLKQQQKFYQNQYNNSSRKILDSQNEYSQRIKRIYGIGN